MLPEPFFDNWEGFAIKKQGGVISYKFYYGFETRNESTYKLILASITHYGISDFDWILIHTGDIAPDFSSGFYVEDINSNRYKFLAYSTKENDYSHTIPDFVFDNWKQTGLDDYETTRCSISRLDSPHYETNCLGWRGALTHPSRSLLISLDDKKDFDCEIIEWDRTDPSRLTAVNFLSFEDQIKKWRYLIDLQGRGYSGRLKLLLSSRRVVFLQDRIHKEFYFPYLKAWEHYVPVKEDLSDLEKNLRHLKNDPFLEENIINNASEFAQLYLTRDFAVYKLAKLLEGAAATAA